MITFTTEQCISLKNNWFSQVLADYILCQQLFSNTFDIQLSDGENTRADTPAETNEVGVM